MRRFSFFLQHGIKGYFIDQNIYQVFHSLEYAESAINIPGLRYKTTRNLIPKDYSNPLKSLFVFPPSLKRKEFRLPSGKHANVCFEDVKIIPKTIGGRPKIVGEARTRMC